MALTIPAYRLPAQIAVGARGGPAFATVIHEAVQGTEQRLLRWASCRAKYDISYGLLQSDDAGGDFAALLAIFYGHAGNFHPFRFRDPNDYQATDEPFGVGVTGAVRQLSKTYDPSEILLGIPGTRKYVRDILLPDQSGLSVEINGSPTTAYSLGDGGVVTFNSDPGSATLTWTGTFDLPVRFDSDSLSVIIEEDDAVQIDKFTIRELIGVVELTSP